MQSTELFQEIQNIGIAQYGDVYLFGSFVKTDGTEYNDIDLYIDADESKITDIKNALELLSYEHHVVPQYYTPMPRPIPTPPWPPKPPSLQCNNILHVTVCSSSRAKKQPFYRTMLNGKHFIIKGSNT